MKERYRRVLRQGSRLAGLIPVALCLCTVAASGQPSLNHGVALLRAGQVADAVAELAAVVEAKPGNLTARHWLGRAHIAAGEYEAAAEQLEAVVEAKQGSAESWLWLGEARAALRQFDGAREAYQRVLRLKPRSNEAREALARLEQSAPSPDGGGSGVAANGPDGFRIGIFDGGLGVSLDDVDIRSPNVLDYTFTGAPTDWMPRGGTWAQSLRWTCSPQWSWYGGWSDGVAALWNKRQFEGDVVVEMYVAYRMGLGNYSGYKNPNDINLTLFGDGANLDSGYTFNVGGDLNMVTRILKGRQSLAETRDRSGLLPILEDGEFSTTGFHRRWWAVRAEVIGQRLAIYMDNKLVLEATDPEPLRSGRVAIWTQDNGIVVARCRLGYGREKTPADPIPALSALLPAAPVTAIPAVQFASATHPGHFVDFESGPGSFRNTTADQGATLHVVERLPGGPGHCLALVNANPGGDAGAQAWSGKAKVGPNGVRWLAFDYRITPDSKINVFARVNGGLYEIVFTGRDDPSYMAQILGVIPDVRADDKWHHAEFDLLGHLRRVYGDQTDMELEEVFFGNRNYADYLMAGFGGNHAGATFYLDNFGVSAPGPSSGTVTCTAPSSAEVKGYAYALDTQPSGSPGRAVKAEGPKADISLDGLREGAYYLHVAAVFEDDARGPTVTRRLVVDASPPTVSDVSPSGKSSAGPYIAARLSDEGVGVDPTTIELVVNGTRYGTDSPALDYDAVATELRFDPTAAGVVFENGEPVDVELASAADYLGQRLASPVRWHFAVDYDQDKAAPPAPILAATQPFLVDDTFEADMGEWQSYGSSSGAVVSRDGSTAASGKYSLRLYNHTNGGLFGAWIRRTAFDAGKYRFVSFDYRINDRVRVDFGLHVNGSWRNVVFTDNDNPLRTIGEVPGLVRDGEWHHAAFDLYEMLKQDDPQASGYVVRYMVLGDWGTAANTQHATYWIDNFRIAPVFGAAAGLSLTCDSSDFTGILATSWVLDEEPTTVPPEKATVDGSSYTFARVADGAHYVHTRAQDGAGNWSEPAHLPIVVDAAPPVAGQVSPAPDSRTAAAGIVIPLQDRGGAGVDPGSVILEVAGQTYTADDRALTYDSQGEQLVWDGAESSPPTAFADQQQVSVALKQAQDYAGNRVTTLPAWSWVMDFSRDDSPPGIRSLVSTTHPTVLADTFEQDLGGWRAYGPIDIEIDRLLSVPVGRGVAVPVVVERDTSTAASGTASVKLTNPAAGGSFATLVTDQPFDALKYQYVSFDYKIQPGVKLDFQFELAGENHALTFTDDAEGAISKIAGVVADGEWHHVSFNLQQMLRSRVTRGSSRGLEVGSIILIDRGQRTNAAGATAHFDNFTIGYPGRSNPSFRWRASDPTGIADYSYVLDADPSTVPDETGEGRAVTKTFTNVRGGLWYFHIRAKDGAGHWGEPAHYTLMHLSAPPTR